MSLSGEQTGNEHISLGKILPTYAQWAVQKRMFMKTHMVHTVFLPFLFSLLTKPFQILIRFAPT